MKQKLLFLLLLLSGGYATTKAQTQFWSDGFEDVGSPSVGTRTVSSAEFNCTAGSGPNKGFFKRTDGSDLVSDGLFTGVQGAKFWAFMNLDIGTGCASNSIVAAQTITWSGINITGKTGLSFKGTFGANSGAVFQGVFFANSTQGYVMDSMAVEYRINGGAWTKIVGIYPNNNTASGGPLAVDNNNDRVGDGTPLDYALTEVSANITGTGTTLDLRFDIFCNNASPGSMAIDNFRLFENTGLPITLSSFEARKENGIAGLYWTTAKEIDNAGFDVQRSNDGKIYQTIGTVMSEAKNGNSNTTLAYSFIDKSPFSGMNFYRLAEKDKKGDIVYSDVRILNFDGKANFNCYPNPVRSQLVVEYNAGKEESMNIRITDIIGKVVMTQAMNVQKGFNKSLVDMSSLAQGIYNMTIISNSGMVYTSKVTKQ